MSSDSDEDKYIDSVVSDQIDEINHISDCIASYKKNRRKQVTKLVIELVANKDKYDKKDYQYLKTSYEKTLKSIR